MSSAGAAAGKPVFSDGYKRLVLALLVAAYTFNFIDRTIVNTLGQAIKEDLKITDTQLGLLGGLYFALLYTFLGIPLARLAERASRVNIITTAIVVWSGFTALCGTAGNFAMLAFYRFGVGVGEAGLSPPAHSLISDYFEPKRRATALSVYSFGIPLGSMLGAMAGGWLAETFDWRVAFLVVGIPGVLVAVAIKLMVKEPPRGHSEPGGSRSSLRETGIGLGSELKEMGAVAATLFGKWPLLNIVLGVTLVSFAGYGGGQFAPPYFIRAFGLNYAEVGLLIGLVAGFGQGIGTLLGGPITDRLAARRGAHWYAIVPAIGIAAAYPFLAAIYLATDVSTAAWLLWIPGILAYVFLGPSFGVVQNMFPAWRRATAAAVLLFFVNLVALGGGPPFTGWMIDHLTAWHWANGGGMADALANFFAADTAGYAAACPGGKGPGACAPALVQGTREGMVLIYGFHLWAAAHFLLAAIGLKGALATARAERGEA